MNSKKRDSKKDTVGRYQIRRKLTEGGMAEVYLAYDPKVGREVALKVIHSRLADDPYLHARFSQEVKAVVALEHSAIVPLYDFGEAGDKPYFVMRYMPGGSLYDRLVKQTPTLAETTRIMNRIASALDAAHQHGIIHRDIKPGNILFDTYGEAFVGDFGIAKLVQEGTNIMTSATGMVGGTPKYMSPEQCRGESNIDGRTDVYALGVMLFEMLTGTPPYNSDTPMGYLYLHLNQPPPPLWSSRPDLPSSLDIVMNKALAKDRNRRYPTAGELAAALSDALNGVILTDDTGVEVDPSSPNFDPAAPTIAKPHTPTSRSNPPAEPPSSPATPESYAETIMSPKAAARLNSAPPQGKDVTEAAPLPSAPAQEETVVASKPADPERTAPTDSRNVITIPPIKIPNIPIPTPEQTAKALSKAAPLVESLTSRIKLPSRSKPTSPASQPPATPIENPRVTMVEDGIAEATVAPAVVAPPLKEVPPPLPQPFAPSKPQRTNILLPLLVVLGGALLTIGSVWLMARQFSLAATFDPSFNPAVATNVASLRVTSTAEANATATSYANATATTIGVSSLTSGFVNATMVPYGLPANGAMEYYSGYESTSSGYGFMRNFTSMVVFQNPAAESTSWSYGIIFREHGQGEQYRLVLTSERTWELYWYVDDTAVDPLATGRLPDSFNVSPEGTNSLTLSVTENRARFWTNNEQVADLNVSGNMEEGTVRLGAFLRGDGTDGAIVYYQGMQTWELENE
jgi:serine/threonine protein kinase